MTQTQGTLSAIAEALRQLRTLNPDHPPGWAARALGAALSDTGAVDLTADHIALALASLTGGAA